MYCVSRVRRHDSGRNKFKRDAFVRMLRATPAHMAIAMAIAMAKVNMRRKATSLLAMHALLAMSMRYGEHRRPASMAKMVVAVYSIIAR